MITKIVIALLIPIVLGLSAFIAYDRWPDGGCPQGYHPVVGGGCASDYSAPRPAATPSCSASKTETLHMACLRNGGEACTEWAKCAK